MSEPNYYCLASTSICRTMVEWGVHWQIINVIFVIIIGIIGIYKIYHELQRLVDQRNNELDSKLTSAKLKRTEFFLNQHRRLFDNSELYSILCLIDDDSIKLIEPGMADKKRKFLTFLEEIALLVRSGQIDPDVAYYMFGYYATCALSGSNFAEGIDTSKKYWGLLYEFSTNSKFYLEQNPDGPPKNLSL
ncbi:hypothetical protein [Janthinobacterium sp. 1_2014MBL_MicDiv]|uniref:hypothetical protein n=1 Tax=Janthinobacterium sp. 1_2014MBL_MicDiv TaxID=1644131 RepID=UPI001E5AB355|nr:hypothetical protein [Janthinobacterium sp. 1_2014MBL_MicDiv]